MDEDAGEEEMEWLMEELEAPPTSSSSSSQRGRSHHGNGHITTKRVNTDGLRSFSLDDQEDDSEDEVLSVPGVRVLKPPGASRNAAANHSAFLQVSARPRVVAAGSCEMFTRSWISGGERRGPGGAPGGVGQKEEEQQTPTVRHHPRQQLAGQQEARGGGQ